MKRLTMSLDDGLADAFEALGPQELLLQLLSLGDVLLHREEMRDVPRAVGDG